MGQQTRASSAQRKDQVSNEDHLSIIEKYSANIYKSLPVVLVEGEGAWVTDTEGKRYLDMLSAYSAINHGHRHPKLVKALKAQIDRLPLTARAFHHDQFAPFCRELAEFTGMDMVIPMNSGAEAVETALKAARRWGYRKKGIAADKAEIIVCENNFHGRTITITGFSTEETYRQDFGPFAPGFKTIAFGDLEALEAVIGPETAAVMLEPIQGEGGIIIPSDGYLKKVSEMCRANNVLLLVDEIQTGMGRVGKRFAFEWEGIRPDIIIMGKALGGGLLPVSAIAANREVLGLFEPGSHGSTFGGNALACAVARESMRVLEEEGLPQRSFRLGEYVLKELRQIYNPLIKDVRGRGLMVGIELKPEAGGARKYCEQLMEEGLLCKETHEHVIRLAPPLIISREDLDWGLERVKKILSA